MTEAELTSAIDQGKQAVLRAVRKHLPGELASHTEDVVQETFLRFFLAFRGKPALVGDDLNRWLYVAAKNESLRAARKIRRGGFALIRWIQSATTVETAANADLPSDERTHALAGNIEKMPTRYREVTRMRLSGKPVAQIARELKMPAGTVKSKLARGREWLARFAGAERSSV